MNIGIVCAMPMEARTLSRSRLPLGEPVQASDRCLLVRSGMGSQNARRATRALQQRGVDAVLSWGCAAGLDQKLAAGTLVCPSSVVNTEGELITADRPLHQALLGRFSERAPLCTDKAMSVDHPIQSGDQKTDLHHRYQAVCLDMESAAIGLAARHYDLPFAMVRVVLDHASQTLPGFALEGLREDGSFSIRAGLSCLIKHPADLLGLAELAINAHRASKTLAWAATQLSSEAPY